jgi:hypothetical protein
VDPLAKYGAIDRAGLVFGYAGATRDKDARRLENRAPVDHRYIAAAPSAAAPSKRIRVSVTDLMAEWQPTASGNAELKLSTVAAGRSSALKMDFDFKGGAGFVVARRALSARCRRSMPYGFGCAAAARSTIWN